MAIKQDNNLIKHESVDLGKLENADENNFYSDGTTIKREMGSFSFSASYFAKSKVEQTLHNSNSLSCVMINRLPTFHMEELELNEMLGSGSFCEVYEIMSIKVLHKSQDGYEIIKKSLLEVDECETESIQSIDSFEERQFDSEKELIAKNCVRKTGEARYAIKYLSPNVVNDNSACLVGAADLAMEVMILSNLNHPNIVQIRGVSATGFDAIGSVQGYFIVLDRLYDTVEQKLPKWKKENSNVNSFNKKEQKIKLAKRLIAAFDLASALHYLHGRKIIYRDLKVQNVGFDARGDIKLFDFGLARELKEEDRTVTGNYNLTGNTGTRRYMAPEVALNESYNVSADVYSFSILLWEICALKRAFKNYSYDKHLKNVILGNKRPCISPIFPSYIKSLLMSMWSKKASERPDLETVLTILEKFIDKYIDKTMHVSSLRRSSFLR